MTGKTPTISAIRAFSDNYIWLIHGPENKCAVVDPGDHKPVLEALHRHGLDLRYILITHHHWDHAGGVPGLLEQHDATVFGPADDRLDSWCQPCSEGDQVELPDLGISFSVLDVPAHTRSHIAFYGEGVLFSGDTLFSIGCGKLFEGDATQMQAAMDKFAMLPADTLVYCGHEYTQSNCQFALQVEPGNEALKARSTQVDLARTRNEITLPSTIADELAANPFMRTRNESVVNGARQFDKSAQPGASTMAAVRAWKDAF